jgi:hypothetical protein
MSAGLETALISGGVTLISVIATLVVARLGFRTTLEAAQTTAVEAHRDTDNTLAAAVE